MSSKSTSRTSAFIDPDDAPPVTQDDVDRAVFRVGLKPVDRRRPRVAVHLDSAVVEFFKRKAGDRDYETLINEALGEYVRAHA